MQHIGGFKTEISKIWLKIANFSFEVPFFRHFLNSDESSLVLHLDQFVPEKVCCATFVEVVI